VNEGAGVSDDHFSFTADQLELRAVLHRFLRDRSPESEVRRLMALPDGFDAGVWAELAGMGLLALAVPEEYGGLGCDLTEVGIVAEESGAALLCAPWFSTAVLATQLLLHSDDQAAMSDYLPPIAAGSCVATVALFEGRSPLKPGRLATRAELHSGVWTVSGAKEYVTDAALADLILVVAATGGGPTLFALDPARPGIAVTRRPTLDMTRKLGTVVLSEAAARPVGAIGGAWPAVSAMLDDAATILAMEQVGGASRVVETAVGYANARFQFGRPIGAFQAVKHRCANMLVELECARSAARYALWAAVDAPEELPVAASLAQAYCSEAFSFIAGESIQVHGGIGFTWEHPAHLYFKRARADAALLGTPREHRARVAELIGI
jgi:alkylation response protein AidB-like acyl-CoA dehydrogenase